MRGFLRGESQLPGAVAVDVLVPDMASPPGSHLVTVHPIEIGEVISSLAGGLAFHLMPSNCGAPRLRGDEPSIRVLPFSAHPLIELALTKTASARPVGTLA